MSLTGLHAFDRAVNVANTWLSEVGKVSENEDREHAYRILRAWLHTLRDRLPVDAAGKFGAQLPLLLRGVYYEGWHPGGTPMRYGREEYLDRFAADAVIDRGEAADAARVVTTALLRHLSRGELDEVLAALPLDLRALLAP